MKLKFTPKQLDPRLDDEGKPIKNDKGVAPVGPFLPDDWDGFVEIRIPTYPEKMRFPKELGIEDLMENVSTDGVTKKLEFKSNLMTMEMMAKASEKVMGFIESVSMKHKKDGFEVKTIEDLYSHPDANLLVTGLCQKFIHGFAAKKT